MTLKQLDVDGEKTVRERDDVEPARDQHFDNCAKIEHKCDSARLIHQPEITKSRYSSSLSISLSTLKQL